MAEQPIEFEQVEALGISREAYDEILDIVGRIPTIDELSTLLAMWESNGKQQSLYGWLRGQRHTVARDEYLYTGTADHRSIREPRVKECLALAQELCHNLTLNTEHIPLNTNHLPLSTGLLLYMVGNVSTEFADSEYARRCLHLVSEPMATDGHDEDCAYIEMILSALKDNEVLLSTHAVGTGGLFCSLLHFLSPTQALKQSTTQTLSAKPTAHHKQSRNQAIKHSNTQAIKQSSNQAIGFDILTPREVRLDAFLFGEEAGRYIVAVDEAHDDQFLLKMDEARLNCCFLGRTTKNRLLVDGYDFGPVADYLG